MAFRATADVPVQQEGETVLNTPDARWERIQEIFHAAADLPASERGRFLTGESTDVQMLVEVRSMLEQEEKCIPLLNGHLSSIARVLDTNPDESPTGQKLGPYVLTRPLGEGGAGRVYLARRADVGSIVAIKILRDAWVSCSRRERFADEQRIVAQLTHPLIARLYDAGVTEDGTPYFVMEYVNGVPVNEYCANHHSTLRERLDVFSNVCEAVRYSHSQAIAHHDIKPSNILVTPDGTIKLLDFGIAKHMEAAGEESLRSSTGLHLMTPSYASPEQWLGKRPGLQADIYSLGIVLYELLTGCLPFDLAKSTPSEAERLVTQQGPPRPSEMVRNGSSLIRWLH